MEPFSAAFLSTLANKLAGNVASGLTGALKRQIAGTPAQQAMERSLHVALVALAAQATAAAPEQETLLPDIFEKFFHHPIVWLQLGGLLRDRPLDHDELRDLFVDAGYGAAKLPRLDFDAALDAFEAAFVEMADNQGELQGIIQTGQLRRQTALQTETLARVTELVALMRELTDVTVRAGQVWAAGRAQPVYQWYVGKVVAQDEVHGPKIVDFRGATIHIVNQYLNAPGDRLWSENDFRDALQTYLTVIEDEYAKPGLRGNIENKDRMPDITLEKMYYSLAALDKPEAREELVEEQVGKSGRTPGHEPKQPVNMATLLRSQRRLVITGKPGCGKSTYLYLIASAVARALQGKGSELVDKYVGLPSPLPLPIYISLGEFNEYRKGPADPSDPRHGTLLAYASRKAIRKYEAFVPKDFFERLIVGNQMCLFLLDGLDEIADETERQHVSEEIRSLSRNPKIGPVIVACRSWAYVDDTRLHAPFVEYEVQSMSAEQVDELVQLWCGAAFSRLQAPKASAKLSQEIRQLEDRRRRRGDIPLADTPLMVTIIAIVFYNDEHLPDQRAALYKRCIRVLLIEKHHPTGEGKTARLAKGGTEEDKLELLPLLAYNMMAAGAKAGRLVEEEDVRSWLLPLIAARQREGKPEEHLRLFLRAMVDHAGLLDERPRTPTRGRSYQFVHLSFQEYLCASHLAGNPPGKVIASLLDGDCLTQTWWREAILLMPGYLAAMENRQAALALLVELGDVPRRDATALAAAELAGSAYLELNFNDRSTHDAIAKRLKDLLLDEELAVPNPLRGLAGRALGRLGDPRPDVAAEVPVTVEIPNDGPFWMGSERLEGQPGYDSYAGENESTKKGTRFQLDLPVYKIGKYPVTVAQYRRFVDAGGYDPQQSGAYWQGGGLEWLQKSGRSAPVYWDDPTWTVDNHPVVGVTWYEAVAYCAWLTATNPGRFFRLPDEAMWEKAARWTDGRRWPWGDTWDAAKLNSGEGGIGRTSAVGIFPTGRSRYGVFDCAGNVWEWCSGPGYSSGASYPLVPQPYTEKGYQQEVRSSAATRALRGGSWYYLDLLTRAAYRDDNYPGHWDNYVGFRVVELLSILASEF